MNLRILKKLSKRAAPYLPRIKDTREVFRAEKNENFTSLLLSDRSCWERSSSAHAGKLRQIEIIWEPRKAAGRRFPYCRMFPPSHPLKGTVMVGSTEGYYEPEWEEETAWESLMRWVINQYWEYDQDTDTVYYTRHFKTSRDIFEAADELLEATA